MKSPEVRKELSELVLHKRGIRLNLQLPTIESEDEICLRPAAVLAGRMLALQCVAVHGTEASSAQLVQLAQPNLSQQELAWCALPELPATSRQFCALALHFLSWCAGVHDALGMPEAKTKLLGADDLNLPQTLVLRSKTALLDQADLLYRLHWAVRHAELMGKEVPGRLDAAAVHAWHHAVNWMIGFEDQDDWDLVSTETAG